MRPRPLQTVYSVFKWFNYICNAPVCQMGEKKVTKAVVFQSRTFANGWVDRQRVSASPLKKCLMCRWFIFYGLFRADVSRMRNQMLPIFGSALCVAASDAERCLMTADFHLHTPQRRRHRRKIDSLSHKWACCTKSTWTHSTLLAAEVMFCFYIIWSRQTTISQCFVSSKPRIRAFQIKKNTYSRGKFGIYR